MKLFKLMHGRSKKKMSVIMIDSYEKCENYRNSREKSKVIGWHDIVQADPEDDKWRQKGATIGGNKPVGVSRVGRGESGYIDKHGFNAHT